VSAAPLSELDAALPGLARKIRVLEALSWPEGVEETFLARWRAGQAELPRVELRPRTTAPTSPPSMPLSVAAMRAIRPGATSP